jgi:hypothetical protein
MRIRDFDLGGGMAAVEEREKEKAGPEGMGTKDDKGSGCE